MLLELVLMIHLEAEVMQLEAVPMTLDGDKSDDARGDS